MIRPLLVALVLGAYPVASPALAEADDAFDPMQVDVADAVNCKLDVPSYNSFALAIMGEDDLAKVKGWRLVETDNPFLREYELPEPLIISGQWPSSRIAFSSTAIFAIVDLADPRDIAQREGVEDSLHSNEAVAAIAAEAEHAGVATRAEVQNAARFRKFLGERTVVDTTEPAGAGSSFGTHTMIARTISNVTTHPGKTLFGCSYRIELLDRTGKPL